MEKIRKAFKQIMKDGEVIYGEGKFDLDTEFITIKAMWQLGHAMYMKDDFEGSTLMYLYVLPRVEALLRYISGAGKYGLKVNGWEVEYRYFGEQSEKEKKTAYKWASARSEKSSYTNEDGSVEEKQHIDYLYSVIRKTAMGKAGRYYIHWNIQYLELNKSSKSYPPRKRILKSAVWWFNQQLLWKFKMAMPDGGKYSDIHPKEIVFSTMPSSGKSLLCNTTNEMFSALSSIKTKKGGVLRISNEQGNISRQSRQTMGLILNKLTLDMYPEFKEHISKSGIYSPFDKASEEEWGLKNCEYEPCTSIFKTRDSAINSVRCEYGMFDDPSRGLQECHNMEVHKRINTLFYGDFSDRFENQDKKTVILTGTMFNPNDIFFTEMDYIKTNIGVYKDERFDNTYISNDGNYVIIINDCEDDYGNSAYPEFISNVELAKKRSQLPDYDYHCIWRQKPIPAEGLIFAKDYLKFYDEVPYEDLEETAYGVLDPTRRKPQDFLSMPILKYNNKNHMFYLIDIVYRQKSILELYDIITQKIIDNNVLHFWYEENTDTSLGTTLLMKLQEKVFNAEKIYKIDQFYSSTPKIQRIVDYADAIKNNIVFPSEKYAPSKTQLGFAVRQLMQFDGSSSFHDDFPDSLAMFADKVIVNNNQRNIIKSYRKRPF